MAYIPNPDNGLAPLDTDFASTAAAEFRALKTKVNTLFLQSEFSVPANSNLTHNGIAVFNIGGDPTNTQDLVGVLSLASRTIGSESTIGFYASVSISDNITTDESQGGMVYGALLEANTSVVNSIANELHGCCIFTVNRNNNGQNVIAGLCVNFANRDASLGDTGSSVIGGIGNNRYNHQAVGLILRSQERSSAGEHCGWRDGIRFENYSLDADDEQPTPCGIDFTGISVTHAEGDANGFKCVPFHFNTDTLDDRPGTGEGTIPPPAMIDGWLPVMIDGIVTHGIPLYAIV